MNSKYVLNIDDVEDVIAATREPMYSGDATVDRYTSDEAAALQRALTRFSAFADGTVGSEYRFRAECQQDVDLFMHAISAYVERPWTITRDESGGFPDVEVQFCLTKAIRPRSLLWAANTVVDGHVIVQTLALAEDYTGERDMDLNPNIHCVELSPIEQETIQMFLSSSEYSQRMRRLVEHAEEQAASMALAIAYVTSAPPPMIQVGLLRC